MHNNKTAPYSWFVSAAGDNTHYQTALKKTVAAMTAAMTATDRAGPTKQARDIENSIYQLFPIPENGQGFDKALTETMTHIVDQSVYPHHPHCCAHLHCPPLIPAIAAEVILTTLNQSMDSWDQAPSATYVEQQLIDWLCQRIGYDKASDGSFTSGGTQANLMALLLARDHAMAQSQRGHSVQHQGLVSDAHRYRILCSNAAHFSVSKSAALLGLGRESVISIDTDDNGALCTQALFKTLHRVKAQTQITLAIVATAGTTDLGAIDPLEEVADLAKAFNCWLHVDAAYGGALLLSEEPGSMLKHLDAADSVTVDFHKMFFQPISCGALLVKNKDTLAPVCFHADYLSREADDELNLVDKSLSTTRRFDALKLWFSLQTIGVKGFSDMLTHIQQLTRYAAQAIKKHPNFDLYIEPHLTTVLFRLVKCTDNSGKHQYFSNEFHQHLRRKLLQSGQAVIAETRLSSRVYLKMTLLNPCAIENDIDVLLATIVNAALDLDRTDTITTYLANG